MMAITQPHLRCFGGIVAYSCWAGCKNIKAEEPQLHETRLWECPFCRQEEVILKTGWPGPDLTDFVNPGHLLVVTRRHVTDFYSTKEERAAINSLSGRLSFADNRFNPDGTTSVSTAVRRRTNHYAPPYPPHSPIPRRYGRPPRGRPGGHSGETEVLRLKASTDSQ